MKKILSFVLALMLLFTLACAENIGTQKTEAEKQLNPYDGDRYDIVNIFPGEDGRIYLAGMFGTIEYETDIQYYPIGFDCEETREIPLAENCELWLPASKTQTEQNVLITDPAALLTWYAQELQSSTFVVEFEINEHGEFTYIAFVCF